MKWITAFFVSLIVSVLLISVVFIFNAYMAQQAGVWMHANAELGFFPRAALQVSGFLRRYLFFIVPLAVIASFAACFAAAIMKKERS